MWLIYLLSGIILLMALYIARNRVQLRSIETQLRDLIRSETTNRVLKIDHSGEQFQTLVAQVNRVLKLYRNTGYELRTEKQNLQWQITSITHDLRTPLTSIIGYIELIEQTDNEEDRNRYIGVIRRKAEVLQSLVNDFYALSKIEDALYPVHLEECDPVTILEDVIMVYYEDFEQNEIALRIDLEPAPMVLASGKDLIRIYANILQNILKYGEKEASVIHNNTEEGCQTIFSNRFSKTRGFDVNRIFDRFYSGDSARSEQSSGLGLYAAKLLAIKQGHDLDAKVEGNTLSVTINYRLYPTEDQS